MQPNFHELQSCALSGTFLRNTIYDAVAQAAATMAAVAVTIWTVLKPCSSGQILIFSTSRLKPVGQQKQLEKKQEALNKGGTSLLHQRVGGQQLK